MTLEETAATLSFFLNHQPVTVSVDPARSLLEVLRDDLGLTGTKQGCDLEGECGACTVLLDGLPVRACLTPAGKVAGRRVLTVEGLAGRDGLHPLQTAFIEVGAVQCGYCTPGMLLPAKALLDLHPSPTRAQIVEALEGNLCRCTGYARIVAAVELAAARLRGEPAAAPEAGRQAVGGDTRREYATDKVTGRARFVEDMSMPGMLHARVVRSPHYHARLVELDTGAARRVPGVVRVITAAEIPGQNGFPGYSQDEPVLVPPGGTVKTRGDPVALVVAATPESARQGVEAVRASYDVLPHTFDPDEALAAGAWPIHADGNTLSTYGVNYGDLAAAMSAADTVIETEYTTSFVEHATLEREAVLGYLDEAGRITVVGGTHEPHWQQEFIAPVLGVTPDRVRVIVPPTGGSFGSRQDPWPLIATALATCLVRQPVRLTYSRAESFLATPKRHPYRVHYRVGVTRAGQLAAARVRITANTGAYDSGGWYIPNFAVVACGGPYRWQAVDAHARSVYTNGPRAGQMRGYGTPQSIFALECTLDEVAQHIGIDPLEFRLKNALAQSSETYLGYPLAESLGYSEVLEAIRPRYREYAEHVAAFNHRPDVYPLRKGLGLAGMWYRFGKYGSLRVEAHAELADDGHFVVYCSAPDYGQGIATVMSQLAAETLKVSRDRIELVNADTALTPDSGIPGASRATYWLGNAVCDAVRNLAVEIQATAAELLDCPPSDVAIVEERVVSGSDPERALPLAEVARAWSSWGKPHKVVGVFDLSPLFPGHGRHDYTPHFVTGAHLAEVVLNLATGQAQVTRMVAAHDVGRAINPPDARGQIEGAMVMGLGAALMEEYLPGHSTGFGDYYLPTVKSMPELEVLLVEVPSFYGPLGAKGLGEAPILPAAPAIVNAVSRAAGVRIRQLPATGERILRAMHDQPRSGGESAG
jgi:CO/xanthine dehydrogenase Mo-binding subunit/aerobic-type carbon monoxide dehydrogenase small subunit (CoxS/CutS family)